MLRPTDCKSVRVLSTAHLHLAHQCFIHVINRGQTLTTNSVQWGLHVDLSRHHTDETLSPRQEIVR